MRTSTSTPLQYGAWNAVLMIGASGPLVINAATYSNLPYSPQKDFIPISSQHEFSDSRLPTVADATVRVFIRTYDAERGVYVNQEVIDPTCLLACLSQKATAVYH